MSDDIVQLIWKRRVRWSSAADLLRARIFKARASALLLSIGGAILETLAASIESGFPRASFWFGATGALCLAAVTFIVTRLVTADGVRRWNRARAVSEGIKHLVYQFRAQAAPFRDQEAASTLQQKVSEIESKASDIEPSLAQVIVPANSEPPPALSPEEYVAKRVLQQVNGYYRPEAQKAAARLQNFRVVEIGASLLATLLAALTAFATRSNAEVIPSTASAWVAVLTTISVALAAHVGANRYDFLVMSYYATARHLEDLLNGWRALGSPSVEPKWSEFVNACEFAISIENEGWMAKWAEQNST